MTTNKHFTLEEAQAIGGKLSIKFHRFDVEQFRTGMDVELEHGKHDARTDVTGDDPLMTGKIALAHLNEFPDYYTRLEKMEEEAKRYHSLREKVERVGIMAKDEFKELVDTIEPTIVDVSARLQKITGIHDEQVSHAKDELEHAWHNMQRAFERFVAKVK
ncbi:MAG: DUF5661 family protein [Caldilineaceae bacterium]